MGQLIVLSGRSGEGKSTFLSQLVASALEQGETAFVYSGELADFHFKRVLDLQLAGERHICESLNEYNDMVYSLNEDVVKKISTWYRGRMFIYDNDYLPDKDDEMETLPETIEKVIKQYGVRLVCVDNLMTAMDTEDTDKSGLFVAQSKFVGRLKRIAVKYQAAIVLVSHPKKTSEKDFTNDTVSGSSDITNKADTVLCFQRDAESGDNQSNLSITKNRLFGILRSGENAIKLQYSPKSRRIKVQYAPDMRYGWEIEEEPQPTWEAVPTDGELPF